MSTIAERIKQACEGSYIALRNHCHEHGYWYNVNDKQTETWRFKDGSTIKMHGNRVWVGKVN